MILYLTVQGSRLELQGGTLKVSQPDGVLRTLPKEQVESISIFGRVQLTTDVIRHCLTREIPIAYYSKDGKYFGRTQSTANDNIIRLKQQIKMSEDQNYCLQLSKTIIHAKVANQLTVLRRLARRNKVEPANIREIVVLKKRIEHAASLEQLIGIEGIIAKNYFLGLSASLNEEFRFSGRTRQPPKDPFNSMISLGYTLMMHEITGNIENVGLSPYCGFLHKDRERHPTLASDLLEEFRAVIVDSVAISLSENQLTLEDFEVTSQGVYLKEPTLKLFLKELEKKLSTVQKYKEDLHSTTFRKVIAIQARELVTSIEKEDPSLYQPIMIR